MKKKYGYLIVSVYASFKDISGNYIFAKEKKHHTWKPIYIGHTSNLTFRLPHNDRKRQCALKNGATHIHAHKNHDGSKARISEAIDLINKWNPVCNA